MGAHVYLYKDKPLFGLYIGHNSVRVMQTRPASNKGGNPRVIGYGEAMLDDTAIEDGVIIKPDVVTTALNNLFATGVVGELTSRRVAVAIAADRTYSRSIQLPVLPDKELEEAVHLEAEQYISVPLKELYLDYTLTGQTDEHCEVYMVAVPRKIVDSYTTALQASNLEPIVIETSIAAEARLFSHSDDTGITTALVDFGASSASISIVDKSTLVTGTVPVGGRTFTEAIQRKFDISHNKANVIKVKYGLNMSKWQKDILSVIEPALQLVVTEIRRTIRYHEDRYGDTHKIGQIVMLGGGSNMPGLGDYLTNALRIPVRIRDPWLYLDHDTLRQPDNNQRLAYATVAGLSLIDPREAFRI